MLEFAYKTVDTPVGRSTVSGSLASKRSFSCFNLVVGFLTVSTLYAEQAQYHGHQAMDTRRHTREQSSV